MSNKEVIDEVCEKGYRLPKPTIIEMPDSIYELMQQMWSLDPDKRPQFDKICTELRQIRMDCGFEPIEVERVSAKTPNTKEYETQPKPTKENYQEMELKEENDQ